MTEAEAAMAELDKKVLDEDIATAIAMVPGVHSITVENVRTNKAMMPHRFIWTNALSIANLRLMSLMAEVAEHKYRIAMNALYNISECAVDDPTALCQEAMEEIAIYRFGSFRKDFFTDEDIDVEFMLGMEVGSQCMQAIAIERAKGRGMDCVAKEIREINHSEVIALYEGEDE